VIEFTRFIWEGHDYIKYVWDEWLADPEGILAVAEYGSHCVGLGKVSLSAPGQWWLEHADGVARLMTSSKRVKVHHLSEKFGYTKVLEVKEFEASSLEEACTSFRPLQKDEIPASGTRPTRP
jgi:hypothetical protein